MNVIDKLSFIDIKDKKVLVTRTKGKDVWYLPGGKRKAGESNIEALTREVKEELSVDIVPETAALYGTFEALAHGYKDGTQVRAVCYTVEYNGSIAPSNEIEECAYVGYEVRDAMPPLGHLVFDDLKVRGLIE
jgi:8-oxo-dGTP diphosphatase